MPGHTLSRACTQLEKDKQANLPARRPIQPENNRLKQKGIGIGDSARKHTAITDVNPRSGRGSPHKVCILSPSLIRSGPTASVVLSSIVSCAR